MCIFESIVHVATLCIILVHSFLENISLIFASSLKTKVLPSSEKFIYTHIYVHSYTHSYIGKQFNRSEDKITLI